MSRATLKEHYPKAVNFVQGREAGLSDDGAIFHHFSYPGRLSTPSHFLAAALDQRRRELGNPKYFPHCPPYNRNTETRPAHVFDEVFEEFKRYVENPAPRNLRAMLDPTRWNPATLVGERRGPGLLHTEGKSHISRKPLLGINTWITQGGFLYVNFYLPGRLERDHEESDFHSFFYPAQGGGGWGSPEPEEVLKVRGFRDLSYLAQRPLAGERYLRSAKLLVLACHSYIEWVIELCSFTLDICRQSALYLTFEDGPGGEPELSDASILDVRDVASAAEIRRRESARREQEVWRDSLPRTYGFTAAQAASAYLRAGGVAKTAHSIILEAITSETVKKPSYNQFTTVINRLRANFPDLFNPEPKPDAVTA